MLWTRCAKADAAGGNDDNLHSIISRLHCLDNL